MRQLSIKSPIQTTIAELGMGNQACLEDHDDGVVEHYF